VRVAVVGYGVEGRAAEAYWSQQGHTVTVHDRRTGLDLPAHVSGRLGGDFLAGLHEVDLIVRSPSVPPELLPGGVPVTSVIREFLQRCPCRVVGVTGTKGKGTTCSLIQSIVVAAGMRGFFGGNIGRPPLEFLPQLSAGDVVVLELSNFQLVDLDRSPDIAVLLALSPDHLNWHLSLEDYYAAKSSIARYQRPTDLVVYDADNAPASRIAAQSPARRIGIGTRAGPRVVGEWIYFGDECVLRSADIPLPGPHNVANVAAAIGASYDLVAGDLDALRHGIRTVAPLPHRLSTVGIVAGRVFVDDSCSTTPETAAAAVRAFGEPKVLILGGSTKGVPFEPLAAAVAAASVRRVLLLGVEGERIARALSAAGFSDYEFAAGTMRDTVTAAAKVSRPGDVVLLSPACASFGQFVDYVDRGDQFVAAVGDLRPSDFGAATASEG
jgi:UDP-N-acetylmuramoylalanine--D-glutamate ligase